MTVGDVVYLKSGGPGMTVCSFPTTDDESATVVCMWCDHIGAPHERILPVSALTTGEDLEDE